MEKVTKLYVKLYIYNKHSKYDTVIQREVEKIDPEAGIEAYNQFITAKELPLTPEKREDMYGLTSFEFYEQSFIIDGEDVYEGKEKSVSPRYYNGVRLPIYEAIKQENDEIIKKHFTLMEKEYGHTHVCKLKESGLLFLIEDENKEIILDEYFEQKKHTK